MRRLSKTKIELEKIARANSEQRKPTKRTAKPRTVVKSAAAPKGVRDNQLLPTDAWTIVLNGDAGAWAKSLGGLFKLHEAVNATENLELFAGLLDAEHTIDGICKILADNFFDGDIEEWRRQRMLEWYPDSEVTSSEQWSTDLKYDWAHADPEHHTVEVLPFGYTGNPDGDNSDKEDRVVIPPYVADGNGVRYAVVGVAGAIAGSFGPNIALTSIVAPTTVAGIGDYAFNGCDALASVSIPAATSIGDYAFIDCASLTSVSLPAATSIGGHAFIGCTSLASVSLPAATSIGDGAFGGCASLATLDLSSFEKSSIEFNLSDWGISLSSGQTITITASDGTFTITGE